MSAPRVRPDERAAQPAPVDGPVAAIRDVLASERRLLEELVAIMRRQRFAVAADDLQTVEESVYATHRVLHTLSEARRRRRTLNRLLGGSDDLPLRELEGALGARMTEDLRHARDEVERVARVLSREVQTNRRALRAALAAGQDGVEAVYGAPAAG